MAKFIDISDVEQLEAEKLLAEKENKRKKKPIAINTSFVKQGGISGLYGSAGGGRVSKIINEFTARIAADGGIYEPGCVRYYLNKLI